MKITNGPGIDGVTNTFAAAIWAIDFALEFAMFGGRSIRFPCDVTNGSLQTMLGPAPNYTPTPLYYAMMFLSSLSYTGPNVGMASVIAGTSSNIKAYSLTVNNQFQIILLNKDTNPNASGVVQILIYSNDVMQCQYLTAPSLNATSNVSWAGYYFVGGNIIPQGNFTVVQHFPLQNNSYHVALNYSQVALCYLGNPSTKFTYQEKSESNLILMGVLMLFLAFFLM